MDEQEDKAGQTSVPHGYQPRALSEVMPREDRMLGAVIGGKYRIERKIGQGGMGEVYLGVNDALGQRVALKFLSRKLADDEGIVSRFLNEARSYCRVSHPNAVTLLEYGQHEDGTLYIITEFVEGQNLAETMKAHGLLSAAQVLSVGMQLCEVLSAAHGEGVIHRDLKPDNIMLTPTSRGRYSVKVLDFGIAKILDEEDGPTTETGSVFGTPEFMSPEQAKGEEADARSDIYALGIILFYMTTGKLPFKGRNKLVVLNQQLHDAPPRPGALAELAPGFEDVILKCLSKSPSGRYASADDVFDALESLQVVGQLVTPTESRAVRLDTVRLDADAHAETSDFEAIGLEMTSLELERPEPIPRSSGVLRVVGVMGVIGLLVGIWFFVRRDSHEDLVLQGQLEGRLEVAQRGLETGDLTGTRTALDGLEIPVEFSELGARRSVLLGELERLEAERVVYLGFLRERKCEEAKGVLGRLGHDALRERLARQLARCERQLPEVPARPVVTSKPVESSKPVEPAAPKLVEPVAPKPAEPTPVELPTVESSKPVEPAVSKPVEAETVEPDGMLPPRQMD